MARFDEFFFYPPFVPVSISALPGARFSHGCCYSPTRCKQSWRNRALSWSSKPLTSLGSRKYHRSLRFHASLPSQYKNPPSDTVPRRCLLPKRTVNLPSKKHASHCRLCPPLKRQGNHTLCSWHHINELIFKAAVLLFAFFCQLVLGKVTW